MFYYLKFILLTSLSVTFLYACGDSEAPQDKQTTEATEEKAIHLPAEVPVTDLKSVEEQSQTSSAIVYIPNGVVYQETIYKDWPYTEAPAATPAAITKSVEEETAAPAANINPQTHTINAQARIFKPDTIYINPGDTVRWVNMTSHNTVSIEGLIPEGAKPWRSALGENLKVTLGVEGIYAYVCEPHIGFGMVGVIVVGQPDNLEEVTQYARDNLKGPFRRLIGKLIKVKIP